MADVLFIGAGMCGLGTAMLLARDGHRVTVLDRDARPPPESPEAAWEAWERKAIPQFRQPHNLMPGLRLMLEAELPDLQEALEQAGASRFDMVNPLPPFFSDSSPRPVDAKLWTYTARRPVAEAVFAELASRERGLTLARGVGVTELVKGTSVIDGVPHVTGVRTASGDTLHADLVVDATGRGSRVPAWLSALGGRPPYEERADCGFTYYTRYFRGKEPERVAPVLATLGTISVLTLPGDNGTWSVTIFAASSDTTLKALRRADKWSDVIRACPLHAHWLDGEPITDVLAMSGVIDRYRRFVVDGTPVATGLVAVGDAWACTNPSAGRGITVGIQQGMRLRDVLRTAADDPAGLAYQYDEVTEREIAPWYHAQIEADRHRFAEMDALREGREPPLPHGLARQSAELFTAMLASADLFRVAMEYVATVTPLQSIFQSPTLVQRLEEGVDAVRGSDLAQLPGPDRRKLLDLVA